MKIIQFCIPSPGEVLVLTDTGQLWERYRDLKDFNSGPNHTPKYLWREVQAPDFGPSHGERVEARHRENRA